MNNRLWLLLVGLLMIVMFFVIYFLMRGYGKQYSDGLSTLTQTIQDPPAMRKAKTVRKVRVIEHESESCIDISSDGIVRSFDTCGGQLSDANRLSNTKNLLNLITVASQIDTSLYTAKPQSSPYITLIIETDEGSETIYIPTNPGGTGGGEIVEIIEKIKEDLPQPTATPRPGVASPVPTLGGVSFTPTPTPRNSPTAGPSPTPFPTDMYKPPFTCDFTEGGTKNPYNVSNSICSTEPSPVP